MNVELSGLEVYGFHGVLAEERQHGQRFLVDVVVVLGGVIERPHPIALQSCGPASLQIDAPLGSNRLVIASPIEAGVAAATALKVTRATLTTPVGAVRLLVWNAVNFV